MAKVGDAFAIVFRIIAATFKNPTRPTVLMTRMEHERRDIDRSVSNAYTGRINDRPQSVVISPLQKWSFIMAVLAFVVSAIFELFVYFSPDRMTPQQSGIFQTFDNMLKTSFGAIIGLAVGKGTDIAALGRADEVVESEPRE